MAKPKQPSKTLTIYIPVAVADEIQELARTQNLSTSKIITAILTDQLVKNGAKSVKSIVAGASQIKEVLKKVSEDFRKIVDDHPDGHADDIIETALKSVIIEAHTPRDRTEAAKALAWFQLNRAKASPTEDIRGAIIVDAPPTSAGSDTDD